MNGVIIPAKSAQPVIKSPVYLGNLTWTAYNGIYYASVETYSEEVNSVTLQGWGSINNWVFPYIGSNGKTVGLIVPSNTFLSGAWVGLKITFNN